MRFCALLSLFVPLRARAEDPLPPRLLMTTGISFSSSLGDGSVDFDGTEFQEPTFANVSFAAGVELLDGRLALLAATAFGFRSTVESSTFEQQDVAGDVVGPIEGPFTTKVSLLTWSWSVGIDTRYNFVRPIATAVVPYVSALISYGQAYTDRDQLTNAPDDQEVLVADNLGARDRVQAGLSFGVEYLFTSAIGLGLDVDLTYAASFWSGARQTDIVAAGSGSEEAERQVQAETFEIVSHALTWGGQLFVSFRY
jgi:hypothetical protein